MIQGNEGMIPGSLQIQCGLIQIPVNMQVNVHLPDISKLESDIGHVCSLACHLDFF